MRERLIWGFLGKASPLTKHTPPSWALWYLRLTPETDRLIETSLGALPEGTQVERLCISEDITELLN